MAAAAAARAAASVHASAASAASAAAAAEAAAPPPVRLGRHEAWTRFLAYEGCWQVCLSAAGEREASAAPFLADGCASLRAAFGFDGLLLKQVSECGGGGDDEDGNDTFSSLPPAGPTLAWDDSEAAALPTLGFKPEVTRTAVIKVTASRLACADLRSRALALVGGGGVRGGGSVGGGGGDDGDLDYSSAPLTLRLRPSSWAFSDGASAPVEADGRAPRGDVLELGPEEMEDELVVEAIVPASNTRGGGRSANAAPVVVARGVVPIADVWQAAGAAASGPEFGSSSAAAAAQQHHHHRGGLLGGLFGGGRGGGNNASATTAAAPFPALDLAPASDDGVLGKKWVTLYDATGVRYGHLALSAWICTLETTVIKAAEIRSTTATTNRTNNDSSSSSSAAVAAAATTTSGGRTPQTVTGWQVYDAVLSAALRAQRCGHRRLSVSGEWAWLLKKFAASYGVRSSYCRLAHARWILQKSNASSTAYCLSLLVEILGPLKADSAANRLLPAENALLAHLERDAVALLAATLESYPVLAEDAPGGVLAAGARVGGAAVATGGGGGENANNNNNTVPPPALAPAVELAGILRDALRPTDTQWLAERFQVAAVRRYVTLETACDAAALMSNQQQHPFGENGSSENESDAFDDDNDVLATTIANSNHAGHDPAAARAAAAAYARLEALAASLRAELVNDLKIHDAAVLPSFVTLPQLAAAEYGREFVAKLRATLARHPPPRPTRAAVDLLVAVGRHAEFLAYHNLSPPAGHAGAIEPRALFGSYVGRWVSGSRAALVARCRELEATMLATATALPDDARSSSSRTTNVAPLVEEMLALTAGEVARYERVVAYWPAFAPALEGVACAALREAAAAASRQCGLTPVPAGTSAAASSAATPSSFSALANGGSSGRRIVAANRPPPSPPRWKWSSAPPVAANSDGTRVVGGGGQGYSSSRGNSSSNPCSSLMVAPHEAVLLNSLRRLLVVAPQMERLLAAWAVGRQEAAAAEAAEEAERVGGEGGGASASAASSRESSPPVSGRHNHHSSDVDAAAAAFGVFGIQSNNSGDSNSNAAAVVVVPRSANSNMPPLGVQLAQLVKELRCEYAGAVTAAAARLSHAVDRIPGRSLAAALEAHGLDVVREGGGSGNDGSAPSSSDAMSRALAPVLEALEEVALGAHRALDARAHAALARGLWDHAAQAVLDYVEGLQEGEANTGGNFSSSNGYGGNGNDDDDVSASSSLSNGAWRGRQAAAGVLAVVDRFFSAVLSGTLGHALQPEDLTPPASSKRAAALLADNTAAADARYTVF